MVSVPRREVERRREDTNASKRVGFIYAQRIASRGCLGAGRKRGEGVRIGDARGG